jgi:hypothetical protein
MAQLARRLPEGERAAAVREGLSAIRVNADDEEQRAKDLIWLVDHMPYLPEADWLPVAKDVLKVVRTISDKRNLATALVHLSYRMPEVEKSMLMKEAVEAARAINDVCMRYGERTDRASELTKLVWHLPKATRKAIVQEALDAAVVIGDEVEQAEALIALMNYLPEAEKAGVVTEALALAKAISSPQSRTRALIAVVLHLPKTERAAIIKEALIPAISDAYELTNLSRSLPEAQKMAILRKAMLKSARTRDSVKVNSCLRIEIARYLPEAKRAQLTEESLAVLPTLRRHDAGLSIALLPLLAPDSSRSEVVKKALAAAASIIDKNSSADELGKLAEELSDWTMAPRVKKVLLAARAAVDEGRGASDLTWLTEYMLYLPDADWLPLGKDVLTAVRAIADKRYFATTLVELLLPLPKVERTMVIQEALGAGAWAFLDGPAETLSALMPHMPEEERTVVTREQVPALLSEMSRPSRGWVLYELSLLSRVIHLLGGDQAEISTFRAICDVCRWWP